MRVLLCEQDDLAAHTPSASTKLIHSGLRYLEYYKLGLVRKALQERGPSAYCPAYHSPDKFRNAAYASPTASIANPRRFISILLPR
uniref:hypothetical protein n=1 Tax=Candidatus Vallotiella sp. (ex Adelges kitamiensis) TaxID=2864217 RepID=UPI001EF1336F|nr:hypothetical protein [Candidatus Vallotia sp. (ex Adelges kitamiensis)]